MNFLRLPFIFDPTTILKALRASPELWDTFTARQTYPGSPHKDTRCIVVRGPKAITRENIQTELESEWLTTNQQLNQAIIQTLFWLNTDRLGRILLVELAPGGLIDEHRDEGLYARTFNRYHFVISSTPGNVFYCREEAVHMLPGEVWWLNHQELHSVANASPTPRIHLIVDVRP